jgi:hypothetical protein
LDAFADSEFGASKYGPIFFKNRFGDIQSGWFGHGKPKCGSLKPIWFQGCRNEDIGVNDQPERDHPRFDFCVRAALTIRSICLELSLSVPLRRDSSPIILSTSGSGVARRT